METIEVGNLVRARANKRTKSVAGSLGRVREIDEQDGRKRALVLWPTGTNGLPHPFEQHVDCELLTVCDLPRWMIPNELMSTGDIGQAVVPETPTEPAAFTVDTSEAAPVPGRGYRDPFATKSAGDFKQGDRVRVGKGKKAEIGTIQGFVHVERRGWRALVAWPSDKTEQFVDLVKLRRVEPEPEPEPKPEPKPEPEEPFDHDKCPGAKGDCGGELRFDPDIVGETCGGLTLRGWDVCTKCGSTWIARKGAVPYDAKWKLASGGRSVETGDGRIRVDGCSNTEALMVRIARLPELELEVARLRKGQP